MKKMDEMDREIQLRSMERGYKAAIVSLCLWVLYNSYHITLLCQPGQHGALHPHILFHPGRSLDKYHTRVSFIRLISGKGNQDLQV